MRARSSVIRTPIAPSRWAAAFGALIVEEPGSPKVDRDVVWVLNDWLVQRNGQLEDSFNHPHDMSDAGRYGNLISVNGHNDPILVGRRNERLRLRLINAATGRIFALEFRRLRPWVIAADGQPVKPRRARQSDLLVGPGNCLDLVIDLPDLKNATVAATDRYDRERTYRLARLTVAKDKAARNAPLGAPSALPTNPIAPFEPKGSQSLKVQYDRRSG